MNATGPRHESTAQKVGQETEARPVPSSGPQPEEKDAKAGPCGLPVKCIIL